MREKYSLDRVRVERRPIPAGGTLVLELDYPPSQNNLFINIARGRTQSTRYREWRQLAAARLLQQRARCVIGAVEIRLTFAERPGRHDIDNLIKPVLDCLVENGIIADDSSKTVRVLSAAWGEIAGTRVEIRSAADEGWMTRRNLAQRA